MRDSRTLIAIAAGVGLLVGYLVNGWLRPDPPERPPAAPAHAPAEARDTSRAGSVAAEIAALKSALDDERSLRGALEMEVEMLRQEIGRERPTRAEPPPFAEGTRKRETQAEQTARKGAIGEEAVEAAHAARARSEWFDEVALVERGVDERRAARLHEQFEELQMGELYLRDEATRGGWLGKPRYRKQLQDLHDESRDGLGEEDYDLLLYASGRNNRVLLSDVLQNSPAAAAGIEPGDVILRYDDQAIFGTRDLLSATTAGASGSTVAVDIDRKGQPVRVYVRRGPLGARINSARRFPSEAR
jgi:hypothetical protein